MRRQRSDSKLLALSPEQREKLHRWFEDDLTFRAIADRLKTEFGIKTHTSSLSGYYKYWGWEKIAVRAVELAGPPVVRRPRSDSKLSRLTPEQVATLGRWFESAVNTNEITRRIRAEMGINTSASAVCLWFKRWQRKRVLSIALLNAAGEAPPRWYARQGGHN